MVRFEMFVNCAEPLKLKPSSGVPNALMKKSLEPLLEIVMFPTIEKKSFDLITVDIVDKLKLFQGHLCNTIYN